MVLQKETQDSVCLTKNSVMMNIPVEIITYYNSEILVTMSNVYRVTSDVVRCRNVLIK